MKFDGLGLRAHTSALTYQGSPDGGEVIRQQRRSGVYFCDIRATWLLT